MTISADYFDYDKAGYKTLKKQASKIIEKWLKGPMEYTHPRERLAFMKEYVRKLPERAEQYGEYLIKLEMLVHEYETEDYTSPITPYGILHYFKSLSEDEVVERLKALKAEHLTERDMRAGYKRLQGIEIPKLPEDERLAHYNTLSTRDHPTLHQLFYNTLGEPIGEMVHEYCDKASTYLLGDNADSTADFVLESLFEMCPDRIFFVLEAVTKITNTRVQAKPLLNRVA